MPNGKARIANLDIHPNLAIITLNRRAFPMAPTEESRLARVDREAQAFRLKSAPNKTQLKFPREPLE